MITTVLLVIAGAVLLMVLKVPVGFAFAAAAVAMSIFLDMDLGWAASNSFVTIMSFTFLALPLYLALGSFVSETGMADKLANLFTSLVGRYKGGLGVGIVLTNAVFGAISGAASAAIAGLARAFIDPMEKAGYPRWYSVALLIPSSCLSQMIPPSSHMIVYGFMSQLPITLCFLAPVIPGIILMISLIIVHLIMVRRIATVTVPPKVPFKQDMKQIGTSGREAILTLLIPILVLGSIYSGIATPTESAGVAVTYTLLVGIFVYRRLQFRNLVGILSHTGATIGSIIILFFFFIMISQTLIVARVSDAILEFMLSVSENKWVIMGMLNILMLFMGMIMDDASGTMIAALILLPVAQSAGFDPYHFAAIADINMSIGLLSPPVAPILYLGGQIGGVPLQSYIKPVMLIILFAYIPTLIITIFIPQLSTWLPYRLLG